MKQHPHSKMNEGMETLRQLASTSLFLQSEKNMSSTTAAVKFDMGMGQNGSAKKEDQLEIVSISDDEECAALVRLNSESYKIPAKKKESTPYSIMDAAVKTSDTSFVLEPVREEQPRPNKLSRSRAPINQPKSKDTNIPLTHMPLDASPNGIEMSSKPENGAYASTTLSLVPSHSQSKNDGNSLPMSRLDPTKTIQDGSTKITMVQSAVTSFASNVSSIEPELVLSPAKLGQ